MRHLYRVFNGTEGLPSTIPGSSTSLTGYWTPRFQSALRLWRLREEAAHAYLNGGTWAVIARVPRRAVVTSRPPSRSRVAPGWDWLDQGEVFVVDLDLSQVQVMDPGDSTAWVPLAQAIQRFRLEVGWPGSSGKGHEP